MGAGPGKTTGWIHRAALLARGVEMIDGATYQEVDDDGLHITVDGKPRLLEVDHVVVCAGQEPNTALLEQLGLSGLEIHVIGGAAKASGLDAKRAIKEGTQVAAGL